MRKQRGDGRVGRCGRGSIAKHAERAINSQEVPRVSAALEAAAFWSSPIRTQVEGEGVIWMIEARQGDRYRAIIQVQPDAPFGRAAQLLVRLAGMEIPSGMTIFD